MSKHLGASACRRVMQACQVVLVLSAVLFAARAAIAVTTVELGDLGGGFSQAVAVNASSQVVGLSTNVAGETHAFSWTQGGGMIELSLGGSHGEATAVNDSGQVVGWSHTPDNLATHAFLWTQAGGMVNLGLGSVFYFSEARAVNANGQVVGRGTRADDFATHASS
jgi:probable HAF family extracellular repeat protein